MASKAVNGAAADHATFSIVAVIVNGQLSNAFAVKSQVGVL